MLSKEKFDEMQDVITDCKTLNGMTFSGNHYKVSQFQKAPMLLGEAVDEILSLREQFAEQREPVVPSTIKISEVVAAVSLEQNRKWNGRVGYMAGWNACRDAILFTAAKPNALPRHIFSMLVNELRDVPAIGCKRELIIGVLNRHGVIAEPVQCDPPATE